MATRGRAAAIIKRSKIKQPARKKEKERISRVYSFIAINSNCISYFLFSVVVVVVRFAEFFVRTKTGTHTRQIYIDTEHAINAQMEA